jgi:hypothetical protein
VDLTTYGPVFYLVAVLAAIALFVWKKLVGEAPVRNADKTLRMTSKLGDVSRTYALPQIVAVLLGLRFIETPIAPVALTIAAVFAGMSWVFAARRLRAVRDTGSAVISSAAQGQVELTGIGRPLGDKPLASPLRRTPCIWFRYHIEEKRGDKWRHVDNGSSEEPFVLDDGTGRCVVEPKHAQVDTVHRHKWREGKRRFVEEWIAPNTKLYALGEFVTENQAAIGRNAAQETATLLSQWKLDAQAMRARFDSDRDGKVSIDEWQVAQDEARAKVEREHAKINELPATNVLRAPRQRSDFIISDKRESDVVGALQIGALLRMLWFGLLLGAALYTATSAAREHRGEGAVVTAPRASQAR